MNRSRIVQIAVIVALVAVGVGGYVLGRAARSPEPASHADHAAAAPVSSTDAAERKVLYWYDPMMPEQRFDQPGKSPFMDMPLQPKYAEEANAAAVKIDPALAQSLGIRLATVETGKLVTSIDAAASVTFNERDVAIIQARTAGFVERVYARAPGDIVAAREPLVDVLVPEWAAAQNEYLAIRAAGDAALAAAARERLTLLGMPSDLIERVERTGKPVTVATITTPVGGVIQSLDVRAGMTLVPGMTLARVNGLSTVWLEAAVPEAQASTLRPGAVVEARLAAFPGETFRGAVAAVLPEANAQTRTLRVRAEFPNRRGRLRPGMFAQMHIASGSGRETAWVPSESVIRTGKRAVVIVATDDGGFQPAEVEIGAEADGKTAVLRGVAAGQKVVVSGQFLIDSEASLNGALGRMRNDAPSVGTTAPLHEAQGRVERITPNEVTVSHGPVPSLKWDAMTMAFKLNRPDMARGVKPGDNIKFSFRQSDDGFVVERLERVGG